MAKNHETPQTNFHVFSQSGLGDAPFGVCHPGDPLVKENTAFFCEHCGTALKNRFFIKSADGKVSVVGIDCLKKAGDQGLIEGTKRIKRLIRAEDREQAAARTRRIRETEEREILGGLTREEAIENLQSQIEGITERHLDKIDDHPVSSMLVHKGFEASMLERAKKGETFSRGMRSALVSLIAKKQCKSRKGSKVYKSAIPDSEALVDDFIFAAAEFQTQVEKFENRIRELRLGYLSVF